MRHMTIRSAQGLLICISCLVAFSGCASAPAAEVSSQTPSAVLDVPSLNTHHFVKLDITGHEALRFDIPMRLGLYMNFASPVMTAAKYSSKEELLYSAGNPINVQDFTETETSDVHWIVLEYPKYAVRYIESGQDGTCRINSVDITANQPCLWGVTVGCNIDYVYTLFGEFDFRKDGGVGYYNANTDEYLLFYCNDNIVTKVSWQNLHSDP